MTEIISIAVGLLALIYAAIQVHRYEQGLKPHTWHVTHKIEQPTKKDNWGNARVTLTAVGTAEIQHVHVNYIGNVKIHSEDPPNLLGSTHGPAVIEAHFKNDQPAYVVLTYGSVTVLRGRKAAQAVRVRLDQEGVPEISHWRWNHILRGLEPRAKGAWVTSNEPKICSQWHIPGLGAKPTNET